MFLYDEITQEFFNHSRSTPAARCPAPKTQPAGADSRTHTQPTLAYDLPTQPRLVSYAVIVIAIEMRAAARPCDLASSLARLAGDRRRGGARRRPNKVLHHHRRLLMKPGSFLNARYQRLDRQRTLFWVHYRISNILAAPLSLKNNNTNKKTPHVACISNMPPVSQPK